MGVHLPRRLNRQPRLQICGVAAGSSSFVPTLQFDAYSLYTDSWLEAAGFEQVVFHSGRPLAQDTELKSGRNGLWLPSVPDDETSAPPYLQIKRSLERSSSAALLSVLVVLDTSEGVLDRDVATAKVPFLYLSWAYSNILLPSPVSHCDHCSMVCLLRNQLLLSTHSVSALCPADSQQ